MKTVPFLWLLLIAVSPMVLAAPEEAATQTGPVKTVDQKAALLEELSFVKSAPQIQKIPMSYRIVPICNKETEKLLKEIKIENDRRRTAAVVLTTPAQLPPALRTANGCPQCTREKAMGTFITIEFSNWLRMLPESRREELAGVCAEI
ncbi:hypothetical protein [Candidatus Cyanaurora vandensis]|uniref:hypothetical protein n=1 Tax=Candidatus Cyanaurora vandensis TaxID=2714958 RepID=UPI00257CA614|nr:hypothetical protein [Candidatus Cyanaurora vandensis]